MYRTILIAIDSSEFSLAAAKVGIELARDLGAKAALLFVIDESKANPDPDTGITHNTAMIVLKKEAEQMLDDISKLYDGEDILKLMPTGDPRKDILKSADELEADLIVLGSHGHSGLRHLLLGGTSEYVMRHSKIPVMIVPLK